MSTARSRYRHRVFGLVLLAASLAMIELMSFLFLNVLASNPRSLEARNTPQHVYEPYRNHALGPGWRSHGRVHNGQGFRRTDDVAQRKAANGYRIFLMGGSAAYGASAAPPFPEVVITNEQTIDYKLERLLQPRFPELHIEVINAGVTAYWTHHHLIYLQETLLDYDPDLIIFLDGINDYYHTSPDHKQFLSYAYSMTLKVGALNRPRFVDLARTFLGWSKQFSNTMFILDEIARRALRWEEPPPDPCQLESIDPDGLNAAFRDRYVATSKRTWVRTLGAVLSVLETERVDAITTLQPELVFEQSGGMGDADLDLLEIEVGLRPAHYVAKKRFLKSIARELAQETAHRYGDTFVDLTDTFDDQAQYFIDYCHVSESGSERIAERLLPYVEQRIQSSRATAAIDDGHGSGS